MPYVIDNPHLKQWNWGMPTFIWKHEGVANLPFQAWCKEFEYIYEGKEIVPEKFKHMRLKSPFYIHDNAIVAAPQYYYKNKN